MSFIYHHYLIFTTKVAANSLHLLIWFSWCFYCLTGFFIVFRFFYLAAGFNFIVIYWHCLIYLRMISTLVKVYFLMYEHQCSEIFHYVNLIPHWEWKNVFMGWLSSVMTTFLFLSLRWGKSVKKLNCKPQWKCSIMLSCRLNPQIPFTLYTCFKEIETHGLCYSFFLLFSFPGSQGLFPESNQVSRAVVYQEQIFWVMTLSSRFLTHSGNTDVYWC